MPDAKYAELRAQVVALVTDVYDRAAQIDETADAVLDLIPTHRADALATRVCRMVAELPDRNSPAEWPEAMLVTHEELRSIVLGALNDDQPTPQPAAQQGEQLVRYCPGCGSIGAVESKYRDCCPDGNEARHIPQALAEKCRDTFRIAIGNLTAAHPSTPAAKANTALHQIIAGVEAALDAAGAPAGTLVERIGALGEALAEIGGAA